MRIEKSWIVSGVLACGFMMAPQHASAAASGCTDKYLNGTYNMQVDNLSIVNVLNSINATPPPSGDVVLPPPPTGGFGNNASSLGGMVPGLGRFIFDGNGNIVGLGTNDNGSTRNAIVGTYSVSDNCTAAFRLNTGQSFNAVIADGGNQALFMQSDGVVGSMRRAPASCISSLGTSQSFAFSLSGAQRTAATATNAATVKFGTYSTMGSVTLNTDGSFALRGWTYQNGAAASADAAGTYTLGFDCSLKLSFGSGTPAATPLNLRGFFVNQQSGILSVQPDSTNTLTTSLIAQ